MVSYYNSEVADNVEIKYTGKYCLPLNPHIKPTITQGFYGFYSHCGKKHKRENNMEGAIDIAANLGTPVYSVLPGKVVYVSSYGNNSNRVTIKTEINGETYYLEYLHMEERLVSQESDIKMGTQVGTVGDIGSKGSFHLDFRVYQLKEGVEPNPKKLYETFGNDAKKRFFDPLEFFDFDYWYNYSMASHDYN